MTAHYATMVFNPKADVFYIGDAIEKFREIIKEASVEIDRREPKARCLPQILKETINR